MPVTPATIPTTPGLVAIDVVRSMLGYPTATTNDDELLQRFIDEASRAFENECAQPIRATSSTFTFTGAGRRIHTPRYHPLSAITALERYDGAGTWTALDDDTYRLVEMDRGRFQQIEYDAGFTLGTRYRATCTVGYASVPADVAMCVAERAALDALDGNITKGDARLGIASKATANAQGIQNATITFTKADHLRRWRETVSHYRALP